MKHTHTHTYTHTYTHTHTHTHTHTDSISELQDADTLPHTHTHISCIHRQHWQGRQKQQGCPQIQFSFRSLLWQRRYPVLLHLGRSPPPPPPPKDAPLPHPTQYPPPLSGYTGIMSTNTYWMQKAQTQEPQPWTSNTVRHSIPRWVFKHSTEQLEGHTVLVSFSLSLSLSHTSAGCCTLSLVFLVVGCLPGNKQSSH